MKRFIVGLMFAAILVGASFGNALTMLGEYPVSNDWTIRKTITNTGTSDATYTVTSADNVVAITSMVTFEVIVLPDSLLATDPTSVKYITVKDESKSCGTYNITINPQGSTSIEGGLTYILNTNGESLDLYSTTNSWFIK